MLAQSLANHKSGLERQASAPQSMPTVQESASLRAEEADSSVSGAGTRPHQPADGDNGRRPSSAFNPADRLPNDGGPDPALRKMEAPDTRASGSPRDETDGFAPAPVSKPQPIPGSKSPSEEPPLPSSSPFKAASASASATGMHAPGTSVPSSIDTPKVLLKLCCCTTGLLVSKLSCNVHTFALAGWPAGSYADLNAVELGLCQESEEPFCCFHARCWGPAWKQTAG